jgi:ATP-dependent DNA helicase RecG
VDYREKFDPAKRWTDRLYPDGTWEANLFQFYQRVWPKLIADLRVPFRLDGAQRKDETPVHEALREALVNALIHTDYTAAGGVVVEHYRDRFVLENPGTLLVSLEQLRRGGISECRNKALQQMFIMIGGGERAGSGFDRIQSGWRSQHWRAPALSTQFHPDRVRLVLPTVRLIPEEVLKALQERFGKRFRGLSKPEVQALVTVYLEGEVSNVRLQELLTDHPVDITHILQGLCAGGFLKSDYRRRWARYRLLQPALTSILCPDSIPLGPDSIPSAISYEELRKIAEPVAGRKKVSPEKMREVILSLCEGRDFSTERLARILKRNPVRLRHRFLAPMVREGILRLRYPEAPNRPDQAYRAARKTP